MKFLVIGSGGREHAIVWSLSRSSKTKKIYCAPGNAGIRDLAECVDINVLDFEGLAAFAKQKKIDLTIVGPELPLVNGIVDYFRKKDLTIFGPSQEAAKLEGSKIFTKKFLDKYHIPTAKAEIFFSARGAIDYVKSIQPPIVIKVDGLAAGKGVIIAKSQDEAAAAAAKILGERSFGDAGKMILIEEYLEGEELSAFAVCNGKKFMMLPYARDFKRALDRDKGPNTGGMGAYSPVPNIKNSTKRFIEEKIFKVVLDGMKRDGAPYVGFLYCGLMLTNSGPKVLEFNIRLGDPEAQVVLPRLDCDFVDILNKVMTGMIPSDNIVPRKKDSAVCVVMASGGYPDDYQTGFPIQGLSDAKDRSVHVFHAGTKTGSDDKQITTSGGRVLGITGMGETVEDARAAAYEAAGKITFNKAHYRTDIAQFLPLKKI